MLLKRLSLVLCTLAFPLTALADTGAMGWRPSDGEVLSFDILMDGKPTGSHVVTFDRTEDRIRVTNDIDIKVKLGPLTVYRYEHDSTEWWSGGEVQFFEGRTKKNGKTAKAAFEKGLEANVIPLTHWNLSELLQAEAIVNDEFEVEPLNRSDEGVETITVGERDIDARRIRIRGEFVVDLWYDDAGRWVKCAFETRGRQIQYQARS